MNQLKPTSKKALITAFAVSIALLYSTQSGSIARNLLKNELFSTIPYLRSLIASLSDIIFFIILVGFSTKQTSLSMTGLNTDIKKPLIWAALLFIPVLIICIFSTPLATNYSVFDFTWLNIGGPFFEELLYRGLAISVLIRLCGWNWIAACLLPALFFGLTHIWQGSDLSNTMGIVAITAAGGLLFGWTFYRWNFNLWPALFLHIGLNTIWNIFALGENAIGGWFGNAMRLMVIIASIGLTIKFAQKLKKNAND